MNTHKKRRAILERVPGYRGQRSRLYCKVKEQLLHSLNYNFYNHKTCKGDFHKLWTQHINVAVRAKGIIYNRSTQGPRLAGIELDRRILAEITASNPDTFKIIANVTKVVPPKGVNAPVEA